jgi:hypothetical protein
MKKLALLGALALAALAASPALAQHRVVASAPATVAPGALLNAVTADTIADLAAGKAFFDAVKDTTASACYGELIAELTAAQTAAQAQSLPKVHLFYTFAIGHEFALALQANSALRVACAPLAEQVDSNVLSLVDGLATGTLSAAKIATMLGLP